jgi:hypothetical protein
MTTSGNIININLNDTMTTSVDTEPSRVEKHVESDDYLVPERVISFLPEWLLPCHLVSAFLHYIQAFILFSYAGRDQTEWPIYTNFPSENDINPDFYGVPLVQSSGTASLTMYGAIYLLISAMYHTCAILPCGRPTYEYYLCRCQSPFRWMEHSLSEGLMKMVVAMLVGVSDAHLLFSIFILMSNGAIFNYVHEQMNARALASKGEYDQWNQSFHMSFVPLLCTWIVILNYYANIDEDAVPGHYIKATVILMIIFDVIFVALFVLQWRQINVFSDYAFGEFCFILLSFTSKTFLAWISYGAASTGY